MNATSGAKSEHIAKAREIVAVLKQHPAGIPRKKLARAAHIKSDWLNFYLNGILKDEPIAYDDRISNLVYWVG